MTLPALEIFRKFIRFGSATLPLSWSLLLVYLGVFWGPMRQKLSISI